ncbi:MAG: hypothetical protein ACREK6_06010 [Candidatus Rokuibacteriota bacterium]
MTDDQYRNLIAFLGERFSEVDGRFQRVDTQFQRVDAQMSTLRAEIHAFRDDVDLRFLEFRSEVRFEFDEVKGMIRLLDRRVERLEAG